MNPVEKYNKRAKKINSLLCVGLDPDLSNPKYPQGMGQFEFCKKIIFKGMKSFVKNYIKQYENCKEVPVHFVGSIAFYLKDELQETFDKYELKLGNVLRRPIDGLIAYHIANK